MSIGRYIYRPMNTPYLPALRSKVAAMGRRSTRTIKNMSLPSLHHAMGHLIPPQLLSDEDEGINSRRRVFFMRRTFWCFLWQTLGAQRACREVVLQVKALCVLESETTISGDTGAYVVARQRLPIERLRSIFASLAATAASKAGPIPGSHGRRILAVDATVIQLADTPEIQKRYPQPPLQKSGCGFPIMKISSLFDLASGSIQNFELANRKVHELPLFFRMFSCLRKGDIWLGDALYNAYISMAYSLLHGIDAVARMDRPRIIDFRQGEKLGPDERLITWNKPKHKSHYLTNRMWRIIPETLQLRLVRVRLCRPGWRPLVLYVVTTLLDNTTYPAEWIAALYMRRWRLELYFRDLKTSLGMEILRTKSPAMAEKEMLMFLIAHNMIRCLIAEAAHMYERSIQSISFLGTVAVARQYCHALALARNLRVRKKLFSSLMHAIAQEVLPYRPDRSEPRALKRRGKAFPRLMISREQFRSSSKHIYLYYLKGVPNGQP
mgnify:CR=1 FL=1